MTKAGINSRWVALGLLVLSSVLYIGTAGSSALVDEDIDAAHALVAREMLQRHDYVVLYMDGIRYLMRPPMHFWMVAASYALLGESEFATRLPLALSMVGLVLLTFAFGRRFFGERAGLYGALAVATSAGMFIFTRTMIPEAIYGLEFTVIFSTVQKTGKRTGARIGPGPLIRPFLPYCRRGCGCFAVLICIF